VAIVFQHNNAVRQRTHPPRKAGPDAVEGAATEQRDETL
jgi:hypothetical protein